MHLIGGSPVPAMNEGETLKQAMTCMPRLMPRYAFICLFVIIRCNCKDYRVATTSSTLGFAEPFEVTIEAVQVCLEKLMVMVTSVTP